MTTGIAKNIGHDAVEAFTRQMKNRLSRNEISTLHQCIRTAVDAHISLWLVMGLFEQRTPDSDQIADGRV